MKKKLRRQKKQKRKQGNRKKGEKLCEPRCDYARFVSDVHCSDNVTLYCKRYQQLVRKFAKCLGTGEEEANGKKESNATRY
jgi:hypothetical protein